MPKSLRLILPLLLLGIGLLFLISAASSILEPFRKEGTLIKVPGEKTIKVESPGSYTVWIQNRGSIDGKLVTHPLDLPAGTTLAVSDVKSGQTIPLTGSSATMTLNDTVRKALGSVELKAPGEIKISVTGLDSPRLLYFSESFAFKTFFAYLYLVVTGGSLILAGIGLGLYFLLRPKPHNYQTLQPAP